MRKAGFICSRTLLFTGWYNKSCYNTVIGRPGYIKTLEKARNTQPVDALPRNTAQNKSDALILSIIPTAAPVKAPMPGRGRVTSRNTDHRHKSRLAVRKLVFQLAAVRSDFCFHLLQSFLSRPSFFQPVIAGFKQYNKGVGAQGAAQEAGDAYCKFGHAEI